MNALLWVLLVMVAAVISAEVTAWCRPAQRFLLRFAASKLPSAQRERYMEEWTAELDALPDGPLTRFLFVTSLVIGNRRLAGELAKESGGLGRTVNLEIDDVRQEQRTSHVDLVPQ